MFSRRHLDVQFQLGQGSFGNSGFDVIELVGAGVAANITKAGGVSLANLEMQIFGMTLEQMNQLSTLGKPLPAYRNNVVTVTAYADDTPKTVVFTGTIQEAWLDFAGMPNVGFTVSAFSALLNKVKPVPPISYPGATDAAQVMSFLAGVMGYNFVNDGVSVVLASPYFSGTAWTQADTCARAGNFNWIIDNNTLAIWPKTGVRSTTPAVVSKETGMIGYPAHTDQGIAVSTIFNPNLSFGGAVTVRSTLTPANGTWAVFSIAHELEADFPEASKWQTTFRANYYGGPTIIAD